MGFNQLNEGLPENCNCIEKAINHEEVVFARHFNKPNLRLQDFSSPWEKDKFLPVPKWLNLKDCFQVCGKKGVSIHIWNKQSENYVIQHYLNIFKVVSPKNKNAVLIFKIKPDAGKVVHTPREYDIFHHDFYKTDNFAIDLLEFIAFINLSDYL